MIKITGTVFVALFFLIGCNVLDVNQPGPPETRHNTEYQKKGPPPHAPAHGYRHKNQHGHEMEYNSDAGAYVVLNLPETYFGNNLYIRVSADGTWMVSATLEGGWRIALGHEVPLQLKAYQQKKNGKNNKSKKHKKQKDDD
ncbi:MAG: hypothetical protein ABIJ31_14115 [Pseudomonadota bacterium]